MAGTIIHADDYGITTDQARRILDCCSACGGVGALNSISILANSPNFEACVELLEKPYQAGVLHLGVHLNIFEGTCCANPESVNLLVDEHGMFTMSFGSLLATGFTKNRKALKDQITHECTCQIGRVLDAFPALHDHLRIDGHQHFQMVPLAFDAVLEAAKQQDCTIEHLRIPREPLAPFLTTPSIWSHLRPINLVKTLLLKTLWLGNRTKLPEYRRVSSLFSGVMLSGSMDYIVNPDLLSKLFSKAEKEGMSLELLFHPGGLEAEETGLASDDSGFDAFYRSEHRKAEAQALRQLRAYLP